MLPHCRKVMREAPPAPWRPPRRCPSRPRWRSWRPRRSAGWPCGGGSGGGSSPTLYCDRSRKSIPLGPRCHRRSADYADFRRGRKWRRECRWSFTLRPFSAKICVICGSNWSFPFDRECRWSFTLGPFSAKICVICGSNWSFPFDRECRWSFTLGPFCAKICVICGSNWSFPFDVTRGRPFPVNAYDFFQRRQAVTRPTSDGRQPHPEQFDAQRPAVP